MLANLSPNATSTSSLKLITYICVDKFTLISALRAPLIHWQSHRSLVTSRSCFAKDANSYSLGGSDTTTMFLSNFTLESNQSEERGARKYTIPTQVGSLVRALASYDRN